jgi:hypothetical protein
MLDGNLDTESSQTWTVTWDTSFEDEKDYKWVLRGAETLTPTWIVFDGSQPLMFWSGIVNPYDDANEGVADVDEHFWNEWLWQIEEGTILQPD